MSKKPRVIKVAESTIGETAFTTELELDKPREMMIKTLMMQILMVANNVDKNKTKLFFDSLSEHINNADLIFNGENQSKEEGPEIGFDHIY